MDVKLFGRTYSLTASSAAGPRAGNQDSLCWACVSGGSFLGECSGEAAGPRPDPRGDMLVAAVCDGMGGLPDGAEAARALSGMVFGWASSCRGGAAEGLASELLSELGGFEAEIVEGLPGSGTTLSAVVASGGEWFSVHLGDSRCYAVGDGPLWRTADHSPVEAMFRAGVIGEDEMNGHPMSSMVSSYVGGGCASKAEAQRIPGGWRRLALCTDGAFGYMPPSDFEAALRSQGDAAGIVGIALLNGGRDNATVLDVRLAGARLR